MNLLLVCFLASGVVAQTPATGESLISVDDFSSCGIVTKIQPNKIQPQCFQFLENATLDSDGSILRRNGLSAYNSTASTGTQSHRGMWAFTDSNGSQYLIAQTSASMISSLGNGTWSAINGLNGGLSTTAQMSCSQCLGFLWCSDGVDPVFSIGPSLATATVSGAPLGKYVGCFRNRVTISGVPSFLTNVYLSGQVNGTDWTVPATQLSTSPAIVNVSGANDGLPVTCLLGEYQNSFQIGRPYDLYGLSGYDLRDFTLRKIDGQIGCMDNNSTQIVNNTQMWLSHRGVEQLTGPQINWASQPIDPTLKTIITAAGNSQATTINGNNFTNGNLTASGAGAPISATIASGNLVPSSWSVSGLFISSITFVMSDVDVSTISSAFFDRFTDGDFSSNPAWTTEAGSFEVLGSSLHVTGGNSSALAAARFAQVRSTGTWSFLVQSTNTGSAGYYTMSYVYASTDTAATYSNSAIAAESYHVVIDNSNTGCRIAWGRGSTGATSLPSPPTSGSFGITAVTNLVAGSCDGVHVLSVQHSSTQVVDVYLDGAVQITTGTTALVSASKVNGFSWSTVGYDPVMTNVYTPNFYDAQVSTAYNTSLSTTTWGLYSLTVSSGASNPASFSVQSSTSLTGSWSNLSAQSLGVIIGAPSRKFLRHHALVSSPLTPAAAVATVTGGSLGAETTGYYITPCIVVSTPSSWGQLNVNAVTNGGSFTFWVSTGGTCAAAISPAATWNAQTANSIITVTTATADVAVRVLFGIDVATEVPTLNNLTVNWNSGASRPPVASATYQNRYYLFYTTSSAVGAANDHAVVYDQNGHWELLDDVTAASAALYLNSLYLGDSSATGTAYLFDTGSDDAGRSYNFAFTTPDLDGGDPVSPKHWSRAYLLLGAPSSLTANTSLACTYTLDGSTETYTLGTVNLSESPTQSGYFVAKFPFSGANPTTSHWVNLSCSNTGTAGPIRVYGMRLVFTPGAWP